MSDVPCERRRGGRAPELPTGGGGRHSLLIVEDQAFMRALLRDFLQSSITGIDVSEAGDGARARKLAGERRPQVVLLDINLPDVNGLELTAEIKKLLPDTQVIVVTSLTAGAYVEHARAAGAIGFVTKEKIYTDLVPLVVSALSIRGTHEPGGHRP